MCCRAMVDMLAGYRTVSVHSLIQAPEVTVQFLQEVQLHVSKVLLDIATATIPLLYTHTYTHKPAVNGQETHSELLKVCIGVLTEELLAEQLGHLLLLLTTK